MINTDIFKPEVLAPAGKNIEYCEKCIMIGSTL